MTEDSKKQEAADRGASTGLSRRKVLITMAGAGVSGVLAEEAEARRVTAGVTSVQKQNFLIAVQAFNNMGTTPQAQSKLYEVLDPTVKVFDITFDHTKLQGPPLDTVISGLYALVAQINGQWRPTFDPYYYGAPDYSQRDRVTGSALWIDSDGSGAEKIRYTFKFNGNSLVSLRGR